MDHPADSNVNPISEPPIIADPLDATIVWCVPADADLRWRQWDEDESLIYHPPSGDTHLLNPLAAEALKLLERQPASRDMLVEHVASIFALQTGSGTDSGGGAEGEAEIDLAQQMEQCLTLFCELGLIEPDFNPGHDHDHARL